MRCAQGLTGIAPKRAKPGDLAAQGAGKITPMDCDHISTPTLDLEARRLLWRCRRGMKELDVLLERFARGVLPTASAEQRTVFARFLELPDPVLVDYLLGEGVPPEPELVALVRRITGPDPAR